MMGNNSIRSPLILLSSFLLIISEIQGFTTTVAPTSSRPLQQQVIKRDHNNHSVQGRSSSSSSSSGNAFSLFMGRAAAVRAQTKGKTDAKKAKRMHCMAKKLLWL